MNQKEVNAKIDKIITPLIRFWEGSNEPWMVKNNVSQFVYSNKRLQGFLGLPKGFNMEGLYDRELPLAIHEFEPHFRPTIVK